MRTAMLIQDVDSRAGVNTLARPRAFFLALGYWASMYGSGMKVVMWGILALFLFFFVIYFRKAMTLNLYLTGFTSSGLEVLLLFGLQAILGNLYQYSALLLGLFMAGLAAGAWFGNRPAVAPRKINVTVADGLLAGCALLSGSLLLMFPWSAGVVLGFAVLLSFASAAVTGYIFAVTSRLLESTGKKRLPELYSADIFGGATGAIGVSVCLLPLAGFLGTAFILTILMALSGSALIRTPLAR